MTHQSETKPEEQMSSAEAADVCVCVSTNDRAVLFSLNLVFWHIPEPNVIYKEQDILSIRNWLDFENQHYCTRMKPDGWKRGLVDRNKTKPKCSLNEHKEEWYLILSNNSAPI